MFEDLERIKRSQFKLFLDTTPNANAPTWKLEGWGVEETSISYNANVDRTKYIVEEFVDTVGAPPLPSVVTSIDVLP